ncbi:MAG: VWA domain-containing protein [Anaerolineae bacterium]|nr:VWA domain-containing protein [Anaerolineae bacterium]NIN97417.1 VWA domain-containing protein [Anaerolineae bacterium]NIQ80349.1 VWA domain-containing protein [Anaerolineae bacterium]
MFNRAAYENSRPDGIGVLEVMDGEEREEDQPRLFVPLKRSELRGEIAGPLGSFQLMQAYGYSKEQLDKVIEAAYRFPLPGDAAVTAVTVRFGEVEIRAQLKEREQAEEEYEKAKEEGRQAALATRESPDVFTLQVAGIRPDQDVTVETSYIQLAKAEGDAWSLRIPLTTAPRYVRSDELTSCPAHGQPLLLLRDPGHRFALDVVVRGAGAVASDTHELAVAEEGEGLRVQLKDGEVIPDRDCVLSWQPQQEEHRAALQVVAHDDADSGLVYFLAQVAPPATHQLGAGVPREIILLVDHSGSMSGPKWEAADWAVEQFLLDLTERDEFALCLFHNSTRWFAKKPQQAESKAVGKAVDFLLAHKDSGGTELGVALEQALHLKRSKDDRARHVVIVTDAQVTDAGRILRLADEEAERDHRRRISVLCIDAAPNSFLASELAERGGGIARFLTSAPDELDITTALDDVLKDWAEPVLADLQLEADRPGAEAAGRQVVEGDREGKSYIDLGDLPHGRTLWVAGRVPGNGRQELTFRMTSASHEEVGSCRLDLAKETSDQPALKALFGARRILGLEYLLNSLYELDQIRAQLERLGYDPVEVLPREPAKSSKVYAENVREDARQALRALLVKEALDYGLPSAETAFVAVRREKGKPVEGTVPVASALPTGWSGDFLFAFAAPMGTARKGAAQPMQMLRPTHELTSIMFSTGDGPRFASADAGIARAEDVLRPVTLFSGVPKFRGAEAVLFDSLRKQDAERLPEVAIVRKLVLTFPDGTADLKDLDPDLSLLIYVGDLSSPRAEVHLADIVRRRGERPLNLRRWPGEVVRVILSDPAGAWGKGAPKIEVTFSW